MKRRVMVTGGAGFLGSRLCEMLLEERCAVLCVDNFSTRSHYRIAHLIEHPDFEVLRRDVTLPLHAEVDEIFNMACPASPSHFRADPVQTTKTAVYGAINALSLARRCGAKVVQASSSQVYGQAAAHPQLEENHWQGADPSSLRACYDEGKRCAETLSFDFQREHAVRVKVARIFSTYGPGMNDGYGHGGLLPTVITQALLGAPISIYGDGSEYRSLCYRDDMTTGLMNLMKCADGFVGPVNLGNPAVHTVLEIVELVLSLTGSASRLQFKAVGTGLANGHRPDISLAKNVVGWEPTIPLRDGLARTIDYFDARLTKNARAHWQCAGKAHLPC